MTKLNVTSTTVSAQQPDGAVALTVSLRTADGTPIVGETITLQRLPEEEDIAPICKTGEQGACNWYVGRGLYQVLFERPLDDISVLALAEGGLRGFGLTVGEEDITYHFTFHSDGHVYFDAAPDAAAPVPIIPTAEHLHGGAEEAPAPEATVIPTATAEPELVAHYDGDEEELSTESAPEPEEPAAVNGRWRLLVMVATGLLAGSGLHWWTRRRNQQRSPARRRSIQTVDDPANQDQDHA